MAAEGARGSIAAGGAPARSQRLGRPPACDSAVTRQRILDRARAAFADVGYGAATNKNLAAAAGVTTSALYHYFPSKFELYAAVHRDAQLKMYERFGRAIASTDTFIGRLEAVLDAAHEMNSLDPTLPRLMASVRVDARRHPELRAAFAADADHRIRFFESIVEIGVRTGEIDEADREKVKILVRTILTGLIDAASYDGGVHLTAVETVKRLFEGKLIRPPA